MAIDAAQMLEDLIALTPEGVPSEGEQAGFAFPEAIVTAVGAGAILGPLAGLLLGGAQGILGKRMRQGELDRAAEEAEIMAQSDEIAAALFDQQRMTAASPEDLAQLDVLQSQYAIASKMLRSPYAETQDRGSALMAQVMEAQRQYEIKNEEQLIAAQQREEEIERAIGQESYNRYKDSRDNFMKESAPYLEVRSATQNILGALRRGTAVDMYAAAKLMDKALDPGSVVRPEEAEAWGQLGSVWQRAGVFMEKLRSGKTLAPEQIAEMEALALAIERQSYEMQVARETRYADEIEDIELPEKYHDNFRLARPLAVPQPAAAVPSGNTPSAAEAAVATALAGADVLDAIPGEVKAGAAGAGLLSVARWGPAATRLAAKFGVPAAAVVAAGEQVPGESDEAYRRRLRRVMEGNEYDERRRPTN